MLPWQQCAGPDCVLVVGRSSLICYKGLLGMLIGGAVLYYILAVFTVATIIIPTLLSVGVDAMWLL